MVCLYCLPPSLVPAEGDSEQQPRPPFSWPMWLLAAHVGRRFLEAAALQTMTGYVTPFATASGASFYVLAPLTVAVSSGHTDSANGPSPWTSMQLVGTGIFAAGQLVQCWTHLALERLKRRRAGGEPRAAVPARLPFTLGLSIWPSHYAAEVATYVGIALSCEDPLLVLVIAGFSAVNLGLTAAESAKA